MKILETDAETTEEIIDGGFYPKQMGKAGDELAGKGFRAAFAAFPGPALVLNGTWDLISRLGEHTDAADGTTVAVISGTGHVCNLERPEAYSSALRRLVLGEPRESAERAAD